MTTGSEPIRSANGLSASVAWQTTDDHAYCLDGQAYTAGSAISWLSSLGLIKGPAELDELARSANRWSRTLCVPALAGLGAPHWDPAAQASFEGISLQTGRPEIVKAVLEGLAAQVAVLARAAVADLGRPLSSLKVDGGLTGSAVLMQLQADLLQVPVEVFSSPDATALGMASLARFGAGLSRSLAPPPTLIARRFEPMISADEATERLARWESAAQRAMAAARHGESG
jgi:glycerol kinase